MKRKVKKDAFFKTSVIFIDDIESLSWTLNPA